MWLLLPYHSHESKYKNYTVFFELYTYIYTIYIFLFHSISNDIYITNNTHSSNILFIQLKLYIMYTEYICHVYTVGLCLYFRNRFFMWIFIFFLLIFQGWSPFNKKHMVFVLVMLMVFYTLRSIYLPQILVKNNMIS